MKHLTTIALACALAFPAVTFAQTTSTAKMTTASGERVNAVETEIRAKVVELNKANRTATLKGAKGELVSVHVPPEAKNFDQVSVGDELVLRYIMATASKLEPIANTGIRERIETPITETAAPGSMPGAMVGRTVEVLADIQSVDAKARTVKIRGATRTFSLAVPQDIDISKLKVGMQVRAVFVEAMVLTVEKAPQAAAKPKKK